MCSDKIHTDLDKWGLAKASSAVPGTVPGPGSTLLGVSPIIQSDNVSVQLRGLGRGLLPPGSQCAAVRAQATGEDDVSSASPPGLSSCSPGPLDHTPESILAAALP